MRDFKYKVVTIQTCVDENIEVEVAMILADRKPDADDIQHIRNELQEVYPCHHQYDCCGCCMSISAVIAQNWFCADPATSMGFEDDKILDLCWVAPVSIVKTFNF